MKDPDTLHDAIREAVKDDLESLEGVNDAERLVHLPYMKYFIPLSA